MYICGEKIANELSFINDFRNSHLVRPNVGYLEVLVNGWPGILSLLFSFPSFFSAQMWAISRFSSTVGLVNHWPTRESLSLFLPPLSPR
jgi:hypothetical protein